MHIHKLILTAAVGLSALTAHSQSTTAKSFYIPADSVNQSTFDHPGADGMPSAFATVIVYAKNDNGYEVLSKKTMESRMVSMVARYIQFTNNEVKLTRERALNAFGGETDKYYKLPQTLLKVPVPGQKAYWSTTQPSGDVEKCTAELASVIISGKTIPAIKVAKQGYSNGGKTLVAWANTTEYYVQGIGLYKIKYKNGQTMEILLEQSYQPLD
ncbi:hypothetical protein IC235_15895 [Hymenobacter sp. BT664]|uniref:GLPGLI family protein n=1 Tax=Hymenobacter montanus TaxID=2771359 RepID=A0A927BEH2_9BACT|nr:hypothetical protein [Hymenobacter montanus]MBD2769371.1 hypothetical protein [Hymenobacter montanus]